MYVLKLKTVDGWNYHGPFGTQDRAERYARSLGDNVEFQIFPLVVPYSVVQRIVWRNNDN